MQPLIDLLSSALFLLVTIGGYIGAVLLVLAILKRSPERKGPAS